MAKKKKKIVVEGQEVDLSKIKSVKLTLNLEIPKSEFDKLLKSMSDVMVIDKEDKNKN